MLLADSQNTSASFYCRQTTKDDRLNNKRSIIVIIIVNPLNDPKI